MPSILLHGADPTTREEKASEILKDRQLHRLDADRGRIKIAQVIELLPHLYIKPQSRAGRGVLIAEAQQMTQEAQSALLKTLEEPPTFLTFVLTVPHPKLLLPTVVSRCLIKGIKGKGMVQTAFAAKIISASPARRLEMFEKEVGYGLADTLSFFDSVEAHLAGPKSIRLETQKIKKMWEAKKMLRDQSTNVKLVVDQLLISW